MSKENAFHVFGDDALGTSDAIELSQRLRRKEVSIEELTQAAISRAERANTRLNVVASSNYHKATSKADKQFLDESKLFCGVPTFIKDNLPTKGFETGFGSAAVAAKTEKRHDPYAKQFSKLGFTILGKSTLPEFGFNATTEPEHMPATRNPWNPEHSCGASSGGAAAMVASGVVPLAHGNDGGGSIRIPAACCGLIGLKPSRGRHVNSLAARALPINLVSEGVLTRSVRDTAYFHYCAESHYQNPRMPRLPLVQSPNTKRLRIAYMSDSVSGQQTDQETLATLEKTAHLLADSGHHIEAIEAPISDHFQNDFPLYWSMMAYAVSKTGRLAFGKQFDASKLDNLTQGLSDYYRKRMFNTPLALLRLRQDAQRFSRIFEEFDALLTPVLSQTPAPIAHLNPGQPFDVLFERLRAYVGFTPLANVAGAPAISIPMGLSRAHTPIGIQLCANWGREDLLLELAYELEEAQPWQHLFH